MREIPFGRPHIEQEERQAVLDVMAGPVLVHGERVKSFERAFAEWTGAPHAVSVSSCTAGMHLVWFALGLGPGDDVIVPAQTHTATAHAVALTGARPVFVDAAWPSGNIDVAQIEAAITPRTRAMAIVHFLGEPVDMLAVMAVAGRHGLFVLEDSALAIGTSLDGVHAGLLGHAGAFSFYPVKHMTTIEGGMVVTSDGDLAAKIERMRAFGVDRTPQERTVPGVYDVTMLGFNYRMNEVQAAVGEVQVSRLDGFLKQRRANHQALASAVDGIEGVRVIPASNGPSAFSSHYCLSVVLEGALAGRRLAVVDGMKARGVGTSVYYPKPVPFMTYYREQLGHRDGEFPVAEAISSQSIALPVGPHLSIDDMTYIAESLRASTEDMSA